jgi:hypothetical protein
MEFEKKEKTETYHMSMVQGEEAGQEKSKKRGLTV